MVQCIGIFLHSSSIGFFTDFLFVNHSFTYQQATAVENMFAWVVLALGIAIFIHPVKLLLVLISVLTFLSAYIQIEQGGFPFSSWAIPATASRYAAPLALIFALNCNKIHLSYWVATLGLCLTFATHGIKALLFHPNFIDYIITSGSNLTGLEICQSAAEILLAGIGLLDIICALAILVYPYKRIFYWMIFWGFITAFARITELGIDMYGEFLIRIAHFTLPLVLLLYFEKEQKHNSIYAPIAQ